MKFIRIFLLILIIIGLGLLCTKKLWVPGLVNKIISYENGEYSQNITLQTPPNYKNAEYIIDGKTIKLINGISEIPMAAGSASKINTKYFGNEIRLDLNDDGREDVVGLLTQETGGTGVFYYVVAALDNGNGYTGSRGLFLGDRIAPQTTGRGEGKIVIVNYADRAPGESFLVKPSIGKSILLLFDPIKMQFSEVVKDFPGEKGN